MADKKEFEAQDEKQIVACRAVSPKAYISIEECKQCEHHKGIKEYAELDKTKYYIVKCNLPTAVRINNLIKIEDSPRRIGGKHGIDI